VVSASQSPDKKLLDRLADQGILRRGVGKPGQGQAVKSRRRRLVSDIVIEDRQ
jgi:hypothetical protein